MKHFDKQMILNDNQHGFRKKRFCKTQLLSTIQEIASSTAKGKQVDVILLDFEKVFDKVLYKLDHYGLRDNTKKWIQSFLSNRSPQVILDGVKSDNHREQSSDHFCSSALSTTYQSLYCLLTPSCFPIIACSSR